VSIDEYKAQMEAYAKTLPPNQAAQAFAILTRVFEETNRGPVAVCPVCQGDEVNEPHTSITVNRAVSRHVMDASGLAFKDFEATLHRLAPEVAVIMDDSRDCIRLVKTACSEQKEQEMFKMDRLVYTLCKS
jgi:hypothetical protein